MKKIMFNDRYGLTQAVLEGRKTQTRRIITCPKTFRGQYVAGFHVYKRALDGLISEICMYDEDERDFDEGQILPTYEVGEIVAVAQRYKDIGYQPTDKTSIIVGRKIEFIEFQEHKGWNNKMFVSCDNMLHFIRITNVRIQRLQDISDEGCLAEGIQKMLTGCEYYQYSFYDNDKDLWNNHKSPREAYAALIDKVSGKGTWEKNPWVWVYDFELVK